MSCSVSCKPRTSSSMAHCFLYRVCWSSNISLFSCWMQSCQLLSTVSAEECTSGCVRVSAYRLPHQYLSDANASLFCFSSSAFACLNNRSRRSRSSLFFASTNSLLNFLSTFAARRCRATFRHAVSSRSTHSVTKIFSLSFCPFPRDIVMQHVMGRSRGGGVSGRQICIGVLGIALSEAAVHILELGSTNALYRNRALQEI